jgi:hypothetical protein
MKELIDLLEKTAQKTIAYFNSQLMEDGCYQNVKDLACYYKSPMMFITANKIESAQLVLKYIQEKFMLKEGDFTTNSYLKSINPIYTEYWSYMNGWILRAAQQLQFKEMSDKAYNYLLKFNLGENKGFLTNEYQLENDISDVLTTAHHGLINLERNNLKIAEEAGNYLSNAIDKQSNLKQGFYLRFESIKLIEKFKANEAPLYFIDKSEPDQLYFMLGYPAAFLGLLYEKTDEKKYLEAAKFYLEMALSCENKLLQSNFSHKVAWAASILYKLTHEKKYLEAIEQIIQHFLNQQAENGLWFVDKDDVTAYDQSAEIACWFFEIAKSLTLKLELEEVGKINNNTVNKIIKHLN